MSETIQIPDALLHTPICSLYNFKNDTIKFFQDVQIFTVGDFLKSDWSKKKCPSSFSMKGTYPDILDFIGTYDFLNQSNFNKFEPIENLRINRLLFGPPCPELLHFLKKNATREEYINKRTGNSDFYYKYHSLLFDKDSSPLGYKKIVDKGITKEL